MSLVKVFLKNGESISIDAKPEEVQDAFQAAMHGDTPWFRIVGTQDFLAVPFDNVKYVVCTRDGAA